MSLPCTRCESVGFINLHQIPDELIVKYQESPDFLELVLKWIEDNEDHDVSVCDCCGDGEGWYGEPGRHYTSEDPQGPDGPYSYNGGLCECH